MADFWRIRLISEERLIDIEIKFARQEDLLESLNQTVYRQQKKIDELEALCAALARRMQDSSAGGDESSGADERPPHY
ncbi:hypothetical protein BH11PSE11_BH11PSE11_08000 [soil metagenome]